MAHFVIMGCGRVGVALAHTLDSAGHSVAVIDQNPEAFRRLSADFSGSTVTGLGFDKDTLEQAEIDQAYAFAAVSSGDNSNILATRVARETYNVPHVVARIYDPGRAEIYQRLGIPTVATVRWTSDQVLRRMLPLGTSDEYRDPTGSVRLCQVDHHPGWVGRRLAAVERTTGARVAFVTRFGTAELPTPETVLQDGDILHVLARTLDLVEVERILTHAPEQED